MKYLTLVGISVLVFLGFMSYNFALTVSLPSVTTTNTITINQSISNLINSNLSIYNSKQIIFTFKFKSI